MSDNGDRRSVATDALDTLGTIIDATQKRDAIHLAVEPVEAGELLRPGQWVTVRDGIAWGDDSNNALGIVDPFLPRAVCEGERFWFVMKPREVRSLRHVWTHPAFPDEAGVAAPVTSAAAEARAKAEAWLRGFCDRSDCPPYEDLMRIIAGETVESAYGSADGQIHPAYGSAPAVFSIGGYDAHGEIPPEFWDHVETVTGRKFPVRPAYFTCSC